MEIDYVIETYSNIYRKINGKLPKISNSQIKLIEKFYTQVNLEFKTYDGWWFDYLCFHFEYFYEKDTRFGKGKIVPNWIFGKVAYERWKNRDDEFWIHWVDKFIDKYNIKRPKNFTKIDPEDIVFYKNQERKRFFNSERGLIHCIENDLYSEICVVCKICKFKSICDERYGNL